jgi:GNAT superfamily N-acetyltransferase
MIIRKAKPTDIKAIVDHNVLLAKETENRCIDTNVVLKGVETVFLNEHNGFYLVAEHDHTIIGQVFITIEWSDWRNQPIWWMHRIYVKKHWRRKGVFKLLFQEIIQKAQKERVYGLRLYMLQNNDLALRVYQQLSFEHTSFIILQNKIK